MAGLPKGRTNNPGGRPKGARNKATAAKEKAIAESGLTPLDYMLEVMRNKQQPEDVRLEAAKAAAPYVHPKLSSVEAKIGNVPGETFKTESNVTLTAEEAYKRLLDGHS